MTEANSYYKNEAQSYFEKGYQKQMEGSLHEAVQCYEKSLEFYPTAEAYTFLGWAYSMQGDYDRAIRECKKAINIDPEYGNPYNDIGAYLIEKGKDEEALSWLEKAVQARRYEAYCYPYYNMGRIWEKKGDLKKALACYQDSLAQKQDYALAQKAVNRLLAVFN